MFIVIIIILFVGWCQRIKSEFKFEYCYLEDELSQVGGSSTQQSS
jgi:hypothetical protein